MREGLLRVAAYCRVSTDKTDQINSLTSQITYFTEYVEKNNQWILYEVYYDEGITGTSTNKREGFNRMISDAYQGRFDLILTKEVSRFARNTVDTLTYTRELRERGIGVKFILDNMDTRDNDGEIRLTIMASLAQDESRKTSERVKWGQKRRMEQGVVFGRDLLGYTVKNGKLYINTEEAELVRRIYFKFLAEGKGTHVIARELREEGLYPKRAKQWSNTVILRVLKNEKYVGDLCQKKTITPNYLTHEKKYNYGQEDKVYLREHHEAIIDRETWEQVQEELLRRSPSNEQKSKYSNRYWCSGKLECGICKSRFVRRTKSLNDGEIYKAWRCHETVVHGSPKVCSDGSSVGCSGSSINEKVLVYGISYILKRIRSNKNELIREMMNEIKSVQNIADDIDIKSIVCKIERLEEKKKKLIDFLLDDVISKEEMKGRTEFYNEEIERLSHKVIEAERMNELERNGMDDAQNYMNEIQDIMEFDSTSEELYRELLDRVIVYPNNIMEVYLKRIPFGMRLHAVTSGHREKYKIEITQMEIMK